MGSGVQCAQQCGKQARSLASRRSAPPRPWPPAAPRLASQLACHLNPSWPAPGPLHARRSPLIAFPGSSGRSRPRAAPCGPQRMESAAMDITVRTLKGVLQLSVPPDSSLADIKALLHEQHKEGPISVPEPAVQRLVRGLAGREPGLRGKLHRALALRACALARSRFRPLPASRIRCFAAEPAPRTAPRPLTAPPRPPADLQGPRAARRRRVAVRRRPRERRRRCAAVPACAAAAARARHGAGASSCGPAWLGVLGAFLQLQRACRVS